MIQIARRTLWLIAVIAFGFMCARHADAGAAPAKAATGDDFRTAWLDRTCKPCDDFSQFATGGWLEAHPIPPKSSWWGHVPDLRDENAARVRSLLEAAALHPHSPAETQAGTFYGACMDEATIAQLGLAPIAPELARIAA